jgi:hypothetical protein
MIVLLAAKREAKESREYSVVAFLGSESEH